MEFTPALHLEPGVPVMHPYMEKLVRREREKINEGAREIRRAAESLKQTGR